MTISLTSHVTRSSFASVFARVRGDKRPPHTLWITARYAVLTGSNDVAGSLQSEVNTALHPVYLWSAPADLPVSVSHCIEQVSLALNEYLSEHSDAITHLKVVWSAQLALVVQLLGARELPETTRRSLAAQYLQQLWPHPTECPEPMLEPDTLQDDPLAWGLHARWRAALSDIATTHRIRLEHESWLERCLTQAARPAPPNASEHPDAFNRAQWLFCHQDAWVHSVLLGVPRASGRFASAPLAPIRLGPVLPVSWMNTLTHTPGALAVPWLAAIESQAQLIEPCDTFRWIEFP